MSEWVTDKHCQWLDSGLIIMQKTDSTPGCSCSMVGLTWDSFEFLSKDMLVRYEMGAGVSVWAAYKPEGFSMFGRGIVEDCGQNSPPSGLIQKLETLFKAYVFVFALIMGSSTPHFQLEMKLINELLPAFPVLPPSCSWWHPKAHHFWPGYQFWQGFVQLYMTLVRSLSTVCDWHLGPSCLWQCFLL